MSALTDDACRKLLKQQYQRHGRTKGFDIQCLPAVFDAMRAAAMIERERIAKGLETEADNSPCAEDASVHRGAAWLVRADFSYEEADRLQTEAEAATNTKPKT